MRGEIVAGRPMDGPVFPERLVAGEDFFTEQIDALPIGG